MTEDEMVGWHHRLNGHEFEQAPGDGEGQGSLVCCSPWGFKELDTTERLNNNSYVHYIHRYVKQNAETHEGQWLILLHYKHTSINALVLSFSLNQHK